MLIHQTHLPHVLAPHCYWSEVHYRREIDLLFRPGWHLVGSADELARDGDFRTFELLGQPIQLRRFDGQWHAFSNICVHRHCTIRCQYHGWEYDPQGRTTNIPESKDFAPWDRDQNRLMPFRVESCGDLLFLCVNAQSPCLTEHLAENFATLRSLFCGSWRQRWSWSTEVGANWKVPIENSLEGYHIPCVHPQTFKVSPTPERTTHILGSRSTSYRTPNVAPSRIESVLFALERCLMGLLGRESQESYTQHHVFPNLLVSSTDMITLCVAVAPLAPTRSRIDVRLFCYDDINASWPLRLCCTFWAKLSHVLARMVLQEDFAIYPDIQRGLTASAHQGCLGAIEERVYAFQKYVWEKCGDEARATPENCNATEISAGSSDTPNCL
jgi:nitrite reductase/ring-hydroxylating ferredoxin subunit